MNHANERAASSRYHFINMDMSDPPPGSEFSMPIYAGRPHACPYLPDRQAVNEFIIAASLDAGLYQQLMDNGFRRSGEVVYRPICEGCRECVPIRVPVNDFHASRSQRRVLHRNTDVAVEIAAPHLTDEKWQIYSAYLKSQHDGAMGESWEDLEEFLYRSPTQTEEMTYHVDGRVVAVGIIDVTPVALSSVYFYFDPSERRRSLGIFGALTEIEECRRRGLPYWYIGYYIRDCRRMNYKVQFRPHEFLAADGSWKP